jgi:hypothetical protein
MKYNIRDKDKVFINEIEHYTNPKYKERFNGFVWGFVIGYIPYLRHISQATVPKVEVLKICE